MPGVGQQIGASLCFGPRANHPVRHLPALFVFAAAAGRATVLLLAPGGHVARCGRVRLPRQLPAATPAGALHCARPNAGRECCCGPLPWSTALRRCLPYRACWSSRGTRRCLLTERGPPPPLLQAEEREQLEEHLSGVVFARQAGRHSATRYMRLPRLDAALPRWRPVSRSCKPTSLVPLATPCRYMTVFFGDLQRTSPGAAAVAVASPAGLEALTAATQFCSGLLPEDDTWVGVILVGGQHVLSVADADICQEPEVRAMVRSSWLVGWLVAPACRPTLPCCSTLACPPLTPPLFRPLPAALTGRRSCRAPPCVRSCAPAQSGCAGWASGMA